MLNTVYNLFKGLPPQLFGAGLVAYGAWLIYTGQVVVGIGFIGTGISDIVHKTNDLPGPAKPVQPAV